MKLINSLVLSLCTLVAAQGLAGEYIVKYKETAEKSMNAFAAIEGLSFLEAHEVGKLMKVKIDESTTALKELKSNDNVEYVVKNAKVQAFRTPPSKQQLREQWANVKVNAEKAWKLAGNKGSQKVIVAVIDTGVDYRHESLSNNMIPGKDFRDNDDDPMDETSSRNPGHGTHVAGSIGATGLASNGVIGLSPVVSILPIRFLGADGGGDLMGAVKAIDFAIEKKADILSNSWGAEISRQQARPILEAVERSEAAGAIFIAAAANSGKNNDTSGFFPTNAGYPNTISVAASDINDAKPSWSNYGRASVHIASPGHEIMSTFPGNKYGSISGTSMATPLVSGVVALLKAQRPDLTGAQARALIQKTGAKVNIETACQCRIDAGAAMEALVNNKEVIVPSAGTLDVNGTQKLSVLNANGSYTYASSNDAVATVSADGTITAKTQGEFVVKATNASGNTVESLKFFVGKSSGGGGGGGGGGGAKCPFEDPAYCDLYCQLDPTLPWCSE